MVKKKILIIFNPTAGHQYPKNYQSYFLKQFNKFLPDIDYEWLETAKDLNYQLKQIKLNDLQRIIIIGGDGTVKEVADFLLTNDLDLPLAIIPQGSANVLASSLNIPLRQKRAIKTACLGQEKRIDVGLLNNQHYFLICLSIGFWSKVVKETAKGLKIKLGFGAYLLTFLKQKKINQSTFNFQLDQEAQQIKGNTLVIANTLSLFKLKPKRKIDFDDGLLDVIITKNKSFWGFLTMGLLALINKRFLPYLFMSQGKKIVINKLNHQKTVQIDGEPIEVDTLRGGRQEIEVEVVPQKLRIIS